MFVINGLGFFLNFKENQLFFGKIAARENPSSTKFVYLSYSPQRPVKNGRMGVEGVEWVIFTASGVSECRCFWGTGMKRAMRKKVSLVSIGSFPVLSPFFLPPSCDGLAICVDD